MKKNEIIYAVAIICVAVICAVPALIWGFGGY